MITDYDDQEIYCRMLGHPLRFSYCRSTDGNTPCRKILNCWFQRFPVQEFIHQHFTEESLQEITAPPKNKILSLLELIERSDPHSNNPR